MLTFSISHFKLFYNISTEVQPGNFNVYLIIDWTFYDIFNFKIEEAVVTVVLAIHPRK